MPDEIPDPDYPYDFVVRRVGPRGVVSWGNGQAYISRLLAGEAVGIEEIGDGVAQLWFGPIYLGLLRREANRKLTFVENKG